MADILPFPSPPLAPPPDLAVDLQIRRVVEAALVARLTIFLTVDDRMCPDMPKRDPILARKSAVREKHDYQMIILSPSQRERYESHTTGDAGAVLYLAFGGTDYRVTVPWGAIKEVTVQRT